MSHLDIYSKIYKGSVLVDDLMKELTAWVSHLTQSS